MKEFLDRFVATFGFTGKNKEKVVVDLTQAIVLQLISELGKKEAYQTVVAQVGDAAKANDSQKLNDIMGTLLSKPDFNQHFAVTAKAVLSDWASSIGSTLPDDRKQEIVRALQTLDQQFSQQVT